MRNIRKMRVLWSAGLVLAASMSAGCQTWMAGMTLPSPRYLEHYPQYFPQEPDFPLPRELAYQEETAGLLAPQSAPAPAVAPPLPVPPAPPFPMPPAR